jgi:hypothetical protein
MTRRIDVSIGSVVVGGASGLDRAELSAAIERGLAQRLAAPGSAGQLTARSVAVADGGRAPGRPDAGSIGNAVVRALCGRDVP